MSILNNTTLLNSLLEKVNNLPEPSEPENLDEELSAQSTLISEQDDKIAELAEVLNAKAGTGVFVLLKNYTVTDDGNGNVVVSSEGA